MWWDKKVKVEKPKGKWELTAEECLQKYGGTYQKALDGLASDLDFQRSECADPLTTIMFEAYRENLLKKKKRKK